ncbi:hypothetical protein Are01nite_45730 [Actinoplanes regularis]|nr:hypothetical protein Are01nite_45730 [Actinoplanes regularis]
MAAGDARLAEVAKAWKGDAVIGVARKPWTVPAPRDGLTSAGDPGWNPDGSVAAAVAAAVGAAVVFPAVVAVAVAENRGPVVS